MERCKVERNIINIFVEKQSGPRGRVRFYIASFEAEPGMVTTQEVEGIGTIMTDLTGVNGSMKKSHVAVLDFPWVKGKMPYRRKEAIAVNRRNSEGVNVIGAGLYLGVELSDWKIKKDRPANGKPVELQPVKC